MAEQDAGIKTFLIADVRGYTAFTEDRGDEAAARLATRFGELARVSLENAGGSLIELRGDEALVVFNSARKAVRAAIALQVLFIDETVADPTLPLAVGIGLDAGEAVAVDGGYRGGALNLAARLCSLAGPGEVLASREVAHLARKVEGIKYVERGSIRLKGLTAPIEVIGVRPELEDLAQDVAFRRALGPSAIQAAQGLEAYNPYKGLRAFEEGDAVDFFGREKLTEDLVARLAETRFLAVVGPSGSGKSSVVRAGLVPALRRGALPGSEKWQLVEMFPGAYPLEELEAALLRMADKPPTSLIEQLRDGERGLLRALKRILPADGSELVLVLDQLEEVFTLVEDEEHRTHFLSILERAVSDPHSRLRIVTTLRADFYDRPLLYSGFAELLRDQVEAVVPLTPNEFERAISRPAERAGVTLEPGLLAEMVADVTNEPGALPLLQYALTELFERREGSALTRDAYGAIGGVSGALARRAEEIYSGLSNSARDAARQLFLRLVTLGEGTEDTRRRVERGELGSIEVDQAAMTAAVDAFGTSRLLSFDRDPRTGTPTVEVAHEALLREWARLRGWIDAARENVRMHRRLAAVAAEWEESERDPSFLLRGEHLAQFDSWSEESGLAVTKLERAYLQTSIREQEAEQGAEAVRREHEQKLERRSVNRMRALVAVFAVAALVAAGLTIFAFRESGRSKDAARIATGRALTAASAANLEVDPERSILLALEAVDIFRSTSNAVPREAVDALHNAVGSSRVRLTLSGKGAGGRVALSPNGEFVATGGTVNSGSAALWETRSGARVLSFPEPEGVHSVGFNADGTSVYVTVNGRGVDAWDTRSGKKLFTLADSRQLLRLAVSPDGTKLATTSPDSILAIWNLRTRKARRIKGPPPFSVSFSPGGGRIAAGAGYVSEAATVWDLSSAKQVLSVNRGHGSVIDVAYSPDGSRLATVGIEGKARIWDARTGRLVATLEGDRAWIYAVTYSPDGRLIATGSGDGTVRVWDAAAGRQLLSLVAHTTPVSALEFSRNGKRLVTSSFGGTTRIWDVSDGGGRDALTFTAHGDVPLTGAQSVAYSPDGARLVTGGGGIPAGLWDARTGQRILALRSCHDVNDTSFSPDGRRIVLAGDGPAFVVDAASGEVVQKLDPPGDPFHPGAAWSPDGAMIGLGGNGTATLWNSRTGRLLRRFAHSRDLSGSGVVYRVAFSPDGSRFFTAGWNGEVKVWATSSGRLLETVKAHGTDQVNGLAINGDGTRMVTGGADGTAKVWSLPSGHRLLTLSGHSGAIQDVAFSPDGKQVATTGDDTTTRLWDAATGELLLTLTGPTFAVHRVAFSPDGRRLATASGDGNVRVYILPLDELISVARRRLTRSWTPAECREFLKQEPCPPAP